jgi:hypothetical protein
VFRVSQEKKLYAKRCSDESALSRPLDQQGCDSDGSREDQVCCGLGSAEEGENRVVKPDARSHFRYGRTAQEE